MWVRRAFPIHAAARSAGTVYLDRPNILNHRAGLRIGEKDELLFGSQACSRA
jgi:hypothetical protein